MLPTEILSDIVDGGSRNAICCSGISSSFSSLSYGTDILLRKNGASVRDAFGIPILFYHIFDIIDLSGN